MARHRSVMSRFLLKDCVLSCQSGNPSLHRNADMYDTLCAASCTKALDVQTREEPISAVT
eukprot:scaffold137639_cov41-Prasinocladus_malaysianus.AAC.2